MDILELAKQSGFFVTLDGKIGREQYQSVHGSVTALERFAEAVRTEADHDRHEKCAVTPQPGTRQTG
ncbi:hypothetical protein IHE31_02035 (plasmid) [Mycetohabitans rhizoxinica]|jgi:hypothetical protein|uniref:Uncharacterized protein n=1 Tax=Mycetohabitans rhizoxinica TaxID=412963 RepID=A0ABZ2PWL8_9BURK|nr:hypothetical protein [Mycetohabitans sp. B2]MCF7697357.1 hypothetical protein [Mycetohabitans sp. B2]